MPSIVKTALALALAAPVVLGVPSTSSSTNTSRQTCVQSMDGQLPSPTPLGFNHSGTVRRYYVAAEEVDWNYAPTGWDNWLGVPIEKSPRSQSSIKYNTTYTKALYRGYTDSSFTKRTKHPAWQGTQGPTLRSEVGDMIEIMFVNKLQNNYATMHSMGLSYNKQNEGSDYPGSPMPGQNSSISTSNAVPPIAAGIAPGNCVVYKWLATEADGPDDGEPARAHTYHSYVDLDIDSDSGLIGPQIVYGKGLMNSTMAEYREISLLYMIYDESNSFMSGTNAKKLSSDHTAANESTFGAIDVSSAWGGNYSIWHPQLVTLDASGRFSDAPSFYTLNGYIFANNPEFQMCAGDKVIWYATGWGAESHVFHMHGNGFLNGGRKQFATNLNDGTSKTLYMTATDTGLWQVICHVSDHHQMGMVANYRVFADNCPLPKLKGTA